MAEVYSEVWVTVNCRGNPQSASSEIDEAWNKILNKYSEYGIDNDTGSIAGVGDVDLPPQYDGDSVTFGLGAKADRGAPNYEKQYQAMGEMVYAIQETMTDWEVDIEIQKTGASG